MIILNLTTYTIENSWKSFQVVTETDQYPDYIICNRMTDLLQYERETWYPKIILLNATINGGILAELINNDLLWAYCHSKQDVEKRLIVLNAILEFEKSLDNTTDVDYYHQKLSDLLSLFTHKEMSAYVQLQTEYDLLNFLAEEFNDDSVSSD